jgi:hypothetical protein
LSELRVVSKTRANQPSDTASLPTPPVRCSISYGRLVQLPPAPPGVGQELLGDVGIMSLVVPAPVLPLLSSTPGRIANLGLLRYQRIQFPDGLGIILGRALFASLDLDLVQEHLA